MSCFVFFVLGFFGQNCGAPCCRVCYHRGLPRLVFFTDLGRVICDRSRSRTIVCLLQHVFSRQWTGRRESPALSVPVEALRRAVTSNNKSYVHLCLVFSVQSSVCSVQCAVCINLQPSAIFF